MHNKDPQAHPVPIGTGRALSWWIDAVQHRAAWVAVAALLLALVLGRYIVAHLSVDTNTEHMLSAQLPWRQAELQMNRLFPHLDPGIVAVIDGDTPEAADSAQLRLVDALRTQPQLFPQVFAFETENYFRRNGLLLLDTEALQHVADRLNQAQPFLGALDRDLSLHGLFTLLDRAVTNADAAAGFDLAPAFNGFAHAVNAAVSGVDQPMSWESLIGAGSSVQPEPLRRFVQITPTLDYTRLFPAAAAMAAIHELQQRLQLDPAHHVSVRLTGSVALEHEELHSAFSGGVRAFCGGMVVVALLLFLALRSLRLVAAAVLTLLFGLIVTGAFATLAVGHLNLISIAFSVLYVGLGIDYSLYLCMQYRELLAAGVAPQEALPRAARDIAGFMTVCAATTSLGFFAFIPTAFTGIAELGLIAGTGMFISLAASLSLLPALIRLLPPDPARVQLRPPGAGRLGRLLDLPYTHARAIWIGAVVLAVGAIAVVPRAHFDYDPLDLRDPKSESVATFRDLLRDANLPPLTLSVVTNDADSATAMAKKLAALPLVAHVLTLADFVPQDQDAKLAILADLNLSLGPSLSEDVSRPVERADDAATIATFHSDLHAYIGRLAARPGAAGGARRTVCAAARWAVGCAAGTDQEPAAGSAGRAGHRQGSARGAGGKMEERRRALSRRSVAQRGAERSRGDGALRDPGAQRGAERRWRTNRVHRIGTFRGGGVPPGLPLLFHRDHHPAVDTAAQRGGHAAGADTVDARRAAHRGRLGAARRAVQFRQRHCAAAGAGRGRGLRGLSGATRPGGCRDPGKYSAHRHRARRIVRRTHHDRQFRQSHARQAPRYGQHGYPAHGRPGNDAAVRAGAATQSAGVALRRRSDRQGALVVIQIIIVRRSNVFTCRD
ncbi:MAG TPA: MMPL family transporter [Steroidobacteraceae bacterium]|nr:MMPL family transporter [Steroidobacteraceae bacterium]